MKPKLWMIKGQVKGLVEYSMKVKKSFRLGEIYEVEFRRVELEKHRIATKDDFVKAGRDVGIGG